MPADPLSIVTGAPNAPPGAADTTLIAYVVPTLVRYATVSAPSGATATAGTGGARHRGSSTGLRGS